jgi:hypothetical protein
LAVSEFGGRWSPLITIVVAGLLVAAASIYVGAHWFLPSDGTTLDFSHTPPAIGLPLHVWRAGQGGLQTGDIVLVMDSRPLDDWILPGSNGPSRPAGDQALYRIEREGRLVNVAVPPQRYDAVAALGDNWFFELALSYLFVMSALVFALRPRLPGARALFLLSTALFASSTVFFLGLQASDLRYGWLVVLWLWSAIVLFGLAMGGLLHFSYVFPRVWPAIARRPAILVLVYAGVWLPYLGLLAVAWPGTTTAASQLSVLVRSTGAITLVAFPMLLINSLIRYRQSHIEAERRQTRWLLWALYVADAPFIAFSVLPGLLGYPPILPPLLLGILWCAIPTAIAIAILRERLFDIDVIIRRTLIYSLLTVALAFVYFGSVVVLQTALVSFTGQSRSTLVTVLSTLAIASLFGPVRRRVQTFIDRRFYRRKYDAARTLTAFAANLREHIDLEQLCDLLNGVVDETMEPEHVSLWIRPEAAASDRQR